jgi:tripartite-type tricarboxylate transporter receptor subunit TctC
MVGHAHSADWPNRTVTVIVPFAAGGFTDMLARLSAQGLSKKFGQPFVIENKTGAGGAIAATAAMNAPPDGYTLFFASVSQTGVAPLFQKIGYDPDKFERISIFGRIPFLLSVKSSLPSVTVPEFVAYAKANPGKLNVATAGVGTTGHLVSVVFAQRVGLETTYVPYKSSGQAVTALLQGEVDMTWGGVSDLTPHLENDKIRVLATSSEARLGPLPNLPTLTETYPGFGFETWNGYLAPPGTPQDIIEKVSKAVIEISEDPANVALLTRLGITPQATTSAEMDRVMKNDKTSYSSAAAAAGVKRAD